MRTLSLTHIVNLRRSARTAYHDGFFDRNFDTYWRSNIVCRMDAPIPFAGYWEAVKEIKLRAWEDEAIAHGEGK